MAKLETNDTCIIGPAYGRGVAVVLKETVTSAYREWAPHPALASSVVCTWHDPARVRPQPVLPDACIDLVWDGQRLSVAGPDTRAVPITDEAEFVGIRFRPGAAPGFLRLGADALVDTRVMLEDIWGSSALGLQERLLAEPQRAAELLEAAVLERLPSASEADPLVNALLLELSDAVALADDAAAADRFATDDRLGVAAGFGAADRFAAADPFGAADPVAAADREAFDDAETPVGQRLAANLGVSQRTLRRRCTIALGYGPKTLERILRFRRALRLVRNGSPLVDAARLAGYADQSHLTNESQRLAGLTPGALAARPSFSLAANGFN